MVGTRCGIRDGEPNTDAEHRVPTGLDRPSKQRSALRAERCGHSVGAVTEGEAALSLDSVIANITSLILTSTKTLRALARPPASWFRIMTCLCLFALPIQASDPLFAPAIQVELGPEQIVVAGAGWPYLFQSREGTTIVLGHVKWIPKVLLSSPFHSSVVRRAKDLGTLDTFGRTGCGTHD